MAPRPTLRVLPASRLAVRRAERRHRAALVVFELRAVLLAKPLEVMATANRASQAPHRLADGGPFSVREPTAAGAAAVELPPRAAVPALVFPGMVALATVAPAMAFRAAAIRVSTDQEMADQETADQETEAPATADLATEAPATADLATADLAAAAPATADPATADPATADPATAAPATADPTTETEAVDLSTEEAFFERSAGLSDPPVSFDIEPDEAPLDFESREVRRAYFKRVVGGIIATLGVGSLLALTRPGPRPPEPLPVAASPEPPPQTLEFEPIIEVAEPAASASAKPAPIAPTVAAASASASARAVRHAPSRASAPRVFVLPPTSKTPPVVPSVNRSPPTARFAD